MICININSIHAAHPHLRAEDWRSPLIRRLLGCDTYSDGRKEITSSYIGPHDALPKTQPLALQWSQLSSDFLKVINTYQVPVITELATLGLACGLVSVLASLEITEVTLRGDRADYWLGDKHFMLEVSGQEQGDLASLCEEKSFQLAENPYGKDGYVCVANYQTATARLWFYPAAPDGGDLDE